MAEERIPLRIVIGPHTFDDGLIPGRSYSIARAWTHRDKDIEQTRLDAIADAFPWLKPTDDTPLLAQDPSVRVIEHVRLGTSTVNIVDDYVWRPSVDGPVWRTWDSALGLHLVTFVLTFARPVSLEELERRDQSAASSLFETYVRLTDGARGIFDDRVREFHTRTNAPVYAIGNGIVGAAGKHDANCVVMRGNTGRLFVADAESHKPVCAHTYDDNLPHMQVDTGHVCPMCGNTAGENL